MSVRITIGLAVALIAFGAGWFWSRAGDSRATPRPQGPRAAENVEPRFTSELEPALDLPETAEAVEAHGGSEAERRRLGTEPAAEGEPTLGLFDAYVPQKPVPLLPPRPAQPGTVAGTVVDENGGRVQVRTMLVGESGSYGGGKTDEDGEFDLERHGYEEFWVKAWTEDGRVGVFEHRDTDASRGVSDAVIQLEEGAKVTLTLEGDRDRCRVGLITNGVRHADFTLRKTQPADPVVPPGHLTVEAYDGAGADKVVYDTRTLYVEPGRDETIEFTLYR